MAASSRPGRLAVLVVGAGVFVMMVTACRTAPDTPEPALEMSCEAPRSTRLGVPTVRQPALLTTSGGRHRFLVEDLPPPSIFSDNEDTEVQLSDPDTPKVALFRVRASLRQPGVVELEAGTYSVLNTSGGAIDVEVCRT